MVMNIITDTLANNGGTFRNGDNISDTLTTGYVVGGIVPSQIVSADNQDELSRVLSQFVATYDVVGTWLHDGMVHVDAVEVYDSREDAISVGRTRGEIAIWNVADSTEITL